MKRYLYLLVAIAFCVNLSVAQNRVNTGLYATQAANSLPSDQAAFIGNGQPNSSIPFDPISSLVSIPGAYDLGFLTKWHLASNGGPLHNIQIDPSNPQKIHACIMGALNTTPDDTTTANFYPNRRVYYFYSADGGQTWSAPKAIANLRTGYPNMILIQRGADYVPVIAAHRNDSEVGSDVSTFLYIETGAPGAGTFKEIATSRETYGSIAQDIIWPAIVLSKDGTKIFTVSSVSTTLVSGLTSIQFGVFTLNEAKTDATWSGWLPGPGEDENASITSGGYYAIRVSASGKIGVVWKNYDSGTPDLGLYLSESADGGATWTPADNIYYSRETSQSSNGGPMSIIAESGLDFFYINEEPNVVFSGYARTPTADADGNVWSQPGSGTLLFWKKGMTDPRNLVSAFVDDAIPGPELESSFLSPWTAGGIDFQGTNLRHPVVALSSDPTKYSVYFTAIAVDDFGLVEQFTEDGRTTPTDSLAYMSVWKITTLNGGATFTNPVKVAGNEDGIAQELRVDHRFPQTSYFNPSGSGNSLEQVMFAADTCPGLGIEGYVGFNNAQWVTKQFPTNAVKSYSYANGLSLGQNYPNPPIAGKTVVPFELSVGGEVTLAITDLVGREVMTIRKGRMEAGKNSLSIDMSSLPSGAYQYTLRSGGESISRLITVVKD